MKKLILSILLIGALSAQDGQMLPQWAYDIYDSKPIRYGVRQNAWGVPHAFAGLFMARVMNSQSLMPLIGLEPVAPERVVGRVFVIACLWEFVEFGVEGNFSVSKYLEIYGNEDSMFWDNAGDIGLATFFAALGVRWNLYKLWRKEDNSQEVLLLPTYNGLELTWRF